MRVASVEGEILTTASVAETEDAETVLVVDDDHTERVRLARMLAKAGYHVLEAGDGWEAIELARQARPDLVLMDVIMPGKDGYQACAELKRDEHCFDIPIILISGMCPVAQKVHGFEVGAVDFITKPFHDSEILARARNHIKMRQLTRQLLEVNRSLLEKQARLDEDLQAAVYIQKTLIPETPPALPEVGIAWRFLPCERVGGDMFHVYQLDETHLGLYVADVSGHGVPAALITVFVSHSLSPAGDLLLDHKKNRRGQRRIRPPGAVLESLDREYPFERFHKHFTICYATLERANGVLRYSSAGHPMPILLRADGPVEFLDKGGAIIGLGASVPFEEGEVTLHAGDRLMVYSDGVVDFTNPEGERFGEGRLVELFGKTASDPLETVCETIVQRLTAFGEGRPLQDDVTLLTLEFRPGDSL